MIDEPKQIIMIAEMNDLPVHTRFIARVAEQKYLETAKTVDFKTVVPGFAWLTAHVNQADIAVWKGLAMVTM